MVSSIILAISAGFIFNASLLNSIDARLDSSHGNFSYVIYGITAGGENWNYVYKAEPDIFSEGGSGVVIERKIYAASLQNIIHQPQLFIKGYLKGFLHYLEKILHFVRTTRHEVSPLRIRQMQPAQQHTQDNNQAALQTNRPHYPVTLPVITV